MIFRLDVKEPIPFLEWFLKQHRSVSFCLEGDFETHRYEEWRVDSDPSLKPICSESIGFLTLAVTPSNLTTVLDAVIGTIGIAEEVHHVQARVDGRYVLKAYDQFCEGCTLLDSDRVQIDALMRQGIIARQEETDFVTIP